MNRSILSHLGLRITVAAVAAVLSFVFVSDWFVPTEPVLIVLAFVFAGSVAWAVWQAFAFVDTIVALRNPVTSPSPKRLSAGDFPQLSPPRKAAVRKIVAVLAEQGVFAPGPPKPDHLFEAISDEDCRVTQEVVLGATAEAGYYHEDFDPDGCMGNLAFHDSKGEQYAETLEQQTGDLVRLANGALQVNDLAIALDLKGRRGTHSPCTLTMVVNGEPISISWLPDVKYLSTHIHVSLAKRLCALETGKRFAWLWSDQGVWISLIANGALDRLNAGPGNDKKRLGSWEWIDESEPVAAGAMFVEG